MCQSFKTLHFSLIILFPLYFLVFCFKTLCFSLAKFPHLICFLTISLCFATILSASPSKLYVDRPEVILGLCCFHDFTFIPKFGLKKLSPVACEAPSPFLQHNFFQKAESCLGRARPRWPPMSAWRLPPVACEVRRNASWGVGCSGRAPISKAKICLCDGAAGLEDIGRIVGPMLALHPKIGARLAILWLPSTLAILGPCGVILGHVGCA